MKYGVCRIWDIKNVPKKYCISLRRTNYLQYVRGTTQIALFSATQALSSRMPLRSRHGKVLLAGSFGMFACPPLSSFRLRSYRPLGKHSMARTAADSHRLRHFSGNFSEDSLRHRLYFLIIPYFSPFVKGDFLFCRKTEQSPSIVPMYKVF